MDGWEMLGKKLLLCLHGWCLLLEPLSHPSAAQGMSPAWHLSWGRMETPPWRTFLQSCGWTHYKHGGVWRNPWKPPRPWEHWSCTRGPCLCSWLALCCCRHIWMFGLVRGCPCVRIILSLQGYSTQELCNPFVCTMPWEATTGQNQMTWGCFFPGPQEDIGRCPQPSEMRALQGGRFRALSLSCRVASSLWSCWRCLLGQATQRSSLCPGEMPRASSCCCGSSLQPALPVWGRVWRGWAPTGPLPSPASEQVTSAGPAVLEGGVSTGMWEAGAGRAQGHSGVVGARRCLEQQQPLIAAFHGAFPQGMCVRAPFPVPLGLAICSQCLCQHQPLAPEPRKH